jgi:hypothetical protein
MIPPVTAVTPTTPPPTPISDYVRKQDSALRKLIKVALELERRVDRLERIIEELTSDGK